MNSKNLLIILAVVVSVIVFMGLKIMSLENNSNTTISLSTNPNPLQPGPATFTILIKDKSDKVVNNAKVSFDLNMVTMDMGVQKGEAVFDKDGQYVAQGRMTMRGPWLLRANVAMPDGSVENKDFSVNVP